jgi:hypothetical protein
MPASVLYAFLAASAPRFRNESFVSPEPSLMPSGPTYGTSPRPACWAASRMRAPPVAVTPPK